MACRTPRNHQLGGVGLNDDAPCFHVIPQSPLNRPHSAPNRDLCDVTEFGQDPPKSDRSHYPKYKPLVFPAPEHDCSNPDYTGPRILTPRIKPCAPPSVGISSTKFCWSEPLLVSGVPTPRPGKPIYSTPDDSAHVDDCGRLSHYSAREQSVVAPVISRHDHSRDPQSVQDTTENGCAGATVSMAGSDVAAGSECEITVALNMGSEFDELLVEDNESPMRAQGRRRHVFVPPAVTARQKPIQMTLEERLLTEREVEAYQRNLEPHETERIDVGAREVHSSFTGSSRVTEEAILSLHASEVGHGSQFSSRLSGGPGAACTSRVTVHGGGCIPAQDQAASMSNVQDVLDPDAVLVQHARTAASSPGACNYGHQPCDFTDDTHTEETSDMHDSFPDATSRGRPCAPLEVAQSTVVMHHNPLCFPESPGTSTTASMQGTPPPPQQCALPALQAGSSPLQAVATQAIGVCAENTASKETQTSRRFTAAALRAALNAHDFNTLSTTSASASTTDAAGESRDWTTRHHGSEAPIDETTRSLQTVCETGEIGIASQVGQSVSSRGRAEAGQPCGPEARHSLLGTPAQGAGSETRFATCVGSSDTALDTSVCLSETGTVFHSCCEPSSLHSSFEVTSMCEQSQEGEAQGAAAGDLQRRLDKGRSYDDTTAGTESFETTSTSEAVGYFACPPGVDKGFEEANHRQSVAAVVMDEATVGVCEQTRAVLKSPLSKLSPGPRATAIKPGGQTSITEPAGVGTPARPPCDQVTRVVLTPRHMVERPPDPPAISATLTDSKTTVLTQVAQAIGSSSVPDTTATSSLDFAKRAVSSHTMLHQEHTLQLDQAAGVMAGCEVHNSIHPLETESEPSGDVRTLGVPRLNVWRCSAGAIVPALTPPPARTHDLLTMHVSETQTHEVFHSAPLEYDFGASVSDPGIHRRRAWLSATVQQTASTAPLMGTEGGVFSDSLSSQLPDAGTMEGLDLEISDTVSLTAGPAVSGALSLSGSRSIASESTCSAPSFKFTVQDRLAHRHSLEDTTAPASHLSRAHTLDGQDSTSSAFCFPDSGLDDDVSDPLGLSGKFDGASRAARPRNPMPPSAAASVGCDSTFPRTSMDICLAGDDSRMFAHADMSHNAMSGRAVSTFSALTPCASCPMRLETVDEHTPSPMQPLLGTRFYMPPACAGKTGTVTAPLLRAHPSMHGDLSPDITWSPFRSRSMRLPSPNYCSPAALGAVHGHTGLPPFDPPSSFCPQPQMGNLQLWQGHPISGDGVVQSCSSGMAPSQRRGEATRRQWLCMRGTPRTMSADGGPAEAEVVAAEEDIEVAASQMDRGRGAGLMSGGRQNATQSSDADPTDTLSLPPPIEESSRDRRAPHAGHGVNLVVHGAAEFSTTATATTVSLSDALLPMPPGDAATESSELQTGMPRAACPAPGSTSGHMSTLSSTARSNSDTAHSGGAAKALPRLFGLSRSDKLGSDGLGHTGVSLQESQEEDVLGLQAGCTQRGHEVAWQCVQEVSGPTLARADVLGETGTWRDVQSLLVPEGQLEHGTGGQGDMVSVAAPMVNATDRGTVMGHANAVDGIVVSHESRARGAGTAGGVGGPAGKPTGGRGAGSDTGSWRGLWACCGTRSMTDE